MRIAFLFNHDQVHQVAHGLPVAIALARAGTGAEILLCSANPRITSELRALAGELIGSSLELIELKLSSRSSRFIDTVAGRAIPSAKLLLYRDNLDFFRSLDVLVVPEKTSLVLKDQFGLDRLKIVHTRHGAGDRAIGFDKASARFDHVLAAGPKIRDRLIAEAGVAPERISMVGYPKFDMFAPGAPRRQQDERPVVIYNPHVAPHLSSWYKKGRAILGWFAANPAYRLIFAPHIMLFERRVVVTIQPPRIARPGPSPREFALADNIEVDTCSRALTTMEYLNRADIYLGDVSSQVYEFLAEPRPCLFFNAHGIEWEQDPNFAHWRTGKVVSDLCGLEQALATASQDHDQSYRAIQEELFRYTFDFNDKPASVRAAQAIAAVASDSSIERTRRAKGSRQSPGMKPGRALAGAAAS
jgi:hypothetical protein